MIKISLWFIHFNGMDWKNFFSFDPIVVMELFSSGLDFWVTVVILYLGFSPNFSLSSELGLCAKSDSSPGLDSCPWALDLGVLTGISGQSTRKCQSLGLSFPNLSPALPVISEVHSMGFPPSWFFLEVALWAYCLWKQTLAGHKGLFLRIGRLLFCLLVLALLASSSPPCP